MSHRRPGRRSLALTAGALALAAPLFSSCGFTYATDRVYTPAATTNDRSAMVDVLGAGVVSTRAGEGTLIGGLSNNSGTKSIALQGINGTDGVSLANVPDADLGPLKYEDLSNDRIAVTGDFEAGDDLTLSFVFSNGETTTMVVPVLTNCDEFSGYDTAFDDDTDISAESSDAPSQDASLPASTSTAEPYSCDAYQAPEGAGEH